MKLVLLTLLYINGLETIQNQTFVTEEELEMIKQELQKLHEEISFLKNPPMTFACATHYADQHLHSISGKTIPYTNLLYSATNVESVLDIAEGTFTAGHPGSYTATWALRADLGYKGTTQLRIYLRKNKEIIEESRQFTWYTGPNLSYDTVGRTLIVHLDKGDTLDLYSDVCTGYLSDVSFCVSLSQFDVV